MVKTVLGVNHQGLRDWIIQRLSAIYMAIFTIALFSYFIWHPNLSYSEWHALLSQVWVKVAILLAVASMLLHAWIGMWTIFTDYVKPFVLRSIINSVVIFMLIACFFWALLILWGV